MFEDMDWTSPQIYKEAEDTTVRHTCWGKTWSAEHNIAVSFLGGCLKEFSLF